MSLRSAGRTTRPTTAVPGRVLMPAVRVGPVSAVRRPRHIVVVVAAIVVAVAAAIASVGVGEFAISPGRVLEVIIGGGDRREELVVRSIRLPRVLLGLAVGAALGLAGAIVQTTARNALASPDLLGVTAGASVGAVAVIVLAGDDGQVSGLLAALGVPAAALLGGLLAAAAVLLVLRRVGHAGLQPLLVGVGFSAAFGGLVSWMLIAASVEEASRATVWLTGSLNGRSWTELWAVASVLAAVLPVLVPLSTRLAAIDLGSDVARGLGVGGVRVQAALLAVAVVLASITAAAAGPIGFVALVGPHLARLACAAPRPPLAASAATGALLVVVCDLVARTAVPLVQLPVGAVTALVGAPFLLWLLIRRRKETGR